MIHYTLTQNNSHALSYKKQYLAVSVHDIWTAFFCTPRKFALYVDCCARNLKQRFACLCNFCYFGCAGSACKWPDNKNAWKLFCAGPVSMQIHHDTMNVQKMGDAHHVFWNVPTTSSISFSPFLSLPLPPWATSSGNGEGPVSSLNAANVCLRLGTRARRHTQSWHTQSFALSLCHHSVTFSLLCPHSLPSLHPPLFPSFYSHTILHPILMFITFVFYSQYETLYYILIL